MTREIVETSALLQELTRGLLTDAPMTEYARKMMETGLHSYTDRVRLYLKGATFDRMARWNRLLQGLSLCETHLTDPEYIQRVKDDPDDPALLLKLTQLLHKILLSEYQELKDEIRDSDSEQKAGHDPKKQYNAFFGPVQVGAAQLPGSLQDPEILRRFRDSAAEILNAMQGKPVPQPPRARTRVLESPVRDVEVESGQAEDIDKSS